MNEHPIFDTHAHYHDARFSEDETLPPRAELLSSLFSETICGIVNVGTDTETSREALALAKGYPRMYAAVGMYPGSCPSADEAAVGDALRVFRVLLDDPKTVAIGEIGFDFHYDDVPREIQAVWFERQLQLAAETGYPVIIHNREAHGATMDLLRKYPDVRGVLHSYSGSAEMAAELMKMGWYISFSGVVTFKNAARMAEVVKSVPVERMLVETDCPYLTPVPFRGRANHSGYLPYTVQRIAELHGTTPEEIADITRKNAETLFRLA